MPAHNVLLMLLWGFAGLVIVWIGMRWLFSSNRRTDWLLRTKEAELRQLTQAAGRRWSLGGFLFGLLVNAGVAILALFVVFQWLEGR